MSFGINRPADPTVPGSSSGFMDSHGSGFQSSTTESATDSRAEDYGTDVWGGQSPYLQALYQGAGRAAGVRPGLDMARLQMGHGLHPAHGLASGFSADRQRQTLESLMRPAGNNPALQAYSRQLGRDFRQNILPGIQDQAAQVGGLGGARQGIAEGQAAADVQANMQNFAGQQYQADQDRRLQAASQMANNIGMRAGLFDNAANFSLSSPWYSLQQFGGLLGGPTVLDQGSLATSTSRSRSSSYGENHSASHSESSGTTGSGGGGGGGFNIGI